MSKAVMISIRPQWCEKIASGEKTIEARKTKPKLETPFKCYIYCDKGRCYGWHISDLRIYDMPKELSEFTGLRDTKFGTAPYKIKRPPQSWCYVEAME